MEECRLVVLSSGTYVGKTAIVMKFVQGIFREQMDPTFTEEFYWKQVEVDGKTVVLDITDTIGQEQFASMRDLYIKNGQGFMLVYSVIDQCSFDDLAGLHEQILRVKGQGDVPIILVGTFSDLEYYRKVGRDQGEDLAHQWSCPFFEVSAKTTVDISEPFFTLVRLVRAGGTSAGLQMSIESCKRVIQSKGELHQRMVTVVMNGLPRIGKTTTKKRVLSIPLLLSQVSPSTGVAEPSLKVTITELPRSSAIVHNSQWKQLSLDDETLQLVDFILRASDSIKSISQPSPGIFKKISRVFRQAATKSRAGEQPHQSPPGATAIANPGQVQNPELVQNPDQLFEEVLTKLWGKLRSSLEDATTIHFIDTGGQPEFQEILPALFSGPSITMLMFKLNSALQERYQVEYVTADGQKSEPYTTSCTIEEVLFQSLATVACYGSEEDPTHSGSVALFVGTHQDKATDEDIQAAEKSLKEKVEKAQYFEKNMIHYPSPGQLILPIDNTRQDDRHVQKLRRVLEDIIHSRFPQKPIPAPWLLFEIALRKAGVQILTMKESQKIAKPYGITSQKELKEALRFLHQMGMVRYYPDVKEVKDLVICDLQILFDGITNLIAHTFTFKKAGEAGRQQFKKTGKFSLEEFQRFCTLKRSSDLLPPEKLVKLLEYLHVLVPDGDKYFMPCVLQTEDLNQPTPHTLPFAPMIVRFECGYCPVGAFSALVVYLLRHSQDPSCALRWKIPQGATVYRNKINFLVGQDLNKVTMIARSTYFEVWFNLAVSQPTTPVHNACKHIRKTILEGLAVVIKSRNFSCKTTPHIGFYCSRQQCPVTPHIAVCEGQNPSAMECLSSHEPVQMLPSQSIWFGKAFHVCPTLTEQEAPIPSPPTELTDSPSQPARDKDHVSPSGDCPTMMELVRFRGRDRRINVPQEISTQCHEFGYLLLDDSTGARVRNIAETHRGNPEQINMDILEQWLVGKGKRPVTWETLVEVLSDIELTTLASDIETVKL